MENIESDSGVHVQLGFGKEMTRRGHQYVVCSQVNPDFWPFEARKIELGYTKYAVRFGMPYAELLNILRIENEIDFVLVNQPETVASVKAALIEANLHKTKIITYIHYLPIYKVVNGNVILDSSLNDGGIGEIILSRILEGCNISDRILLHSQWGEDLIADLFLKKYGKSLSEKITQIPPPADLMLFETEKNWDLPLEKIISYPNRPYAHYGTEKLFSQLNCIQKKYPFKVYVSDPLANQSITRKNLDSSSAKLRNELKRYPFIIWGSDEDRIRSNYFKKLTSSRLVLAPNRSAALWSMAIIDGMANGRPALAPNAGGFKDILPPDLLWNNEHEFQEKLISLLQEPQTWRHYAKLCYSSVQRLNPSSIGQKLEDCLYNV